MLNVQDNLNLGVRYKYTMTPDTKPVDVDIDKIQLHHLVMYTYHNYEIKSLVCMFTELRNASSNDYSRLTRIDMVFDNKEYETFMPQGGGIIFEDRYECYEYLMKLMSIFDNIYLLKEDFTYQRTLIPVNVRSSYLTRNIERGLLHKSEDYSIPFLYRRYHPWEIHPFIAPNRRNTEMVLSSNYSDLPELELTRGLFRYSQASEFYCVVYECEGKWVFGWYPKSYCIDSDGRVKIYNMIELNGKIWDIRTGKTTWHFPKKIRTVKTVSHWEAMFHHILHTVSDIYDLKNVVINKNGVCFGKLDIMQLSKICVEEKDDRELHKDDPDWDPANGKWGYGDDHALGGYHND